MTAQERRALAASVPLARIASVFGVIGGFLFLRVWWPIQAERNLVALKRIETQVFQKKSELNALNERYAALTSLTVIDHWAKSHGPWVPARADNVIAIE